MAKEGTSPDERMCLLLLLEEARFIQHKLLAYFNEHPSTWPDLGYDELMDRIEVISNELERHEQNLANAIPPKRLRNSSPSLPMPDDGV